jgi:hypothetical protein
MKSSTMQWMIAAAALVVAAGSASAQTYKAEIPMAFRAADKVMEPGSYEIQVSSGALGNVLFVRNSATQSAVALLATVKSDAPKAWRMSGDPRIAFECLAGACRLQQIWNGSAPFAYVFPAPKAPSGVLAATRLEVLTLAMVKAR